MANLEWKIHLIVVLLIFSSIPSFEAFESFKCSHFNTSITCNATCSVKLSVRFVKSAGPVSRFTYGCTPPISVPDGDSEPDTVARYFVLTNDGHLFIYGQCRGDLCNEPNRALDRNMRRQFDSIKKKCPSALVKRDSYHDSLAPIRCHSTDNADCECDIQQSLAGSMDGAWCFRRGQSTGCCLTSNCRWRNGENLPFWYKNLEKNDDVSLEKARVMVIGIFDERDRIDSRYVLCRDKSKECNTDPRAVRNFVQEICRVLGAEMETVAVVRWWYVFVPLLIVALLLTLGAFSIVKRWNVRILIG